jgi:mono/diheme cytochrome c family protein
VKTTLTGIIACLWAAAVCVATHATTGTPGQPAASSVSQSTPVVDYQQQVHPILAENCLGCHSAEKRSGGLSLASYADALDGGRSGAAVRPGDGRGSLIVRRLTGEVAPPMPLGKAALPEAQLDIIRSWIDQGARETPASAAARPKWEAPLALDRPPLPDAVWKTWAAPVDRFVASYLAEHGIAEPELIADAAFARRAYLDLWGLLPPPADLQAFLSDTSPSKRSTLVQRLLADAGKYAEHWISFWNDLLRNDEGVNYYSETASRKSITGWLQTALESNLPYDRFVEKLLNPARPEDPDGFLIGVNWRGEVSASQTPAMQAAQNTAQVFLGLNLKCNSCHDSFISKWKLKDAYGLASFFSDQPRLQLYRCDVAQNQYAEPQFLYPELNRVPMSASPADRRSTAAAIFTDRRNGRLPRTLVNRIWHRLFGRGIVENPDEMDGEPWSPPLLDWLAADLVEHGYDVKHLLATIASSRAYQMHAVTRTGEPPRRYMFNGPEVRRMTAEQFADAIAAITGDWNVYQPPAGPPPAGPPPARYTRDWRTPATALTRALGRPIRDQVFTSRESMATTLQALELVNGEVMTRSLLRGARRMLGEQQQPPAGLFVASINSRGNRAGADPSPMSPATFDLDIAKAERLWLVVQDAKSTALDKAEAVWAQAELVAPGGAITRLDQLEPVDRAPLRSGPGPIALSASAAHGVRVRMPSRLEYDIAGRGFTRFRGVAGLEHQDALSQGETLLGRFLIFDREPDMDRLVPPAPGTPMPSPPRLTNERQVVDWVFWYALGRAPSGEERVIAENALRDPAGSGRVSADGLADLLWSVVMKPEFQLIW